MRIKMILIICLFSTALSAQTILELFEPRSHSAFGKTIPYHRKSIRLKEYDYTQPGMYFVTICTYNHECIFGNIIDGEMRLNAYGSLVESEWMKTPKVRRNVSLDAFVIMPNHLHSIFAIDCRGVLQYAPTPIVCHCEP